MRKWLLVSILAVAGTALPANRASAWWYCQPTTAAVSFPMLTPSGYFTNTYYFAWYYPWYANYNYSHGSYAHWYVSHGWAFYPGQQIPPNFHIHQYGGAHIHGIDPRPGMDPHHHPHPLPAPKKDGPPKKDLPKKEPGKVTITLPADAKLLFNGVAAAGTGESRTFRTPDLEEGRDYEYVLTAEVVRDGQTLTAVERVIVRAGSDTPVTLAPAASAAK